MPEHRSGITPESRWEDIWELISHGSQSLPASISIGLTAAFIKGQRESAVSYKKTLRGTWALVVATWALVIVTTLVPLLQGRTGAPATSASPPAGADSTKE